LLRAGGVIGRPEHGQRLGMSEDARRTAGDEPLAVSLAELPAIQADTIHVRAGGRLEGDARVADRRRTPRALGPPRRRSPLVPALSAHRLVALAALHSSYGLASLHPADVDVVHAILGEDAGTALGVAGIDRQAVADDHMMDRQLVLESSHAPDQIRDDVLQILHDARVQRWPSGRQCSTRPAWLEDSKERSPSSRAAGTASDAPRSCVFSGKARPSWSRI